jgi:hypothetical protein
MEETEWRTRRFTDAMIDAMSPSEVDKQTPTLLKDLREDIDQIKTSLDEVREVVPAAISAASVPYTPTDFEDWAEDEEDAPTSVEEGLDAAGSRLTALEGASAPAASTVAYTPETGANWTNPDPENVAEALDDGIARVVVLEAAKATSTTVSTGSVAATGGTVNLDIPLPTGFTSGIIGPIVVTRTAGDGTSFKLAAYTKNDRSDDPRWLFGNGGSAITIGATPLLGPIRPLDGGHILFSPMAYVNADGSNAVRMIFTNGDGAEVMTCSVKVTIQPLP